MSKASELLQLLEEETSESLLEKIGGMFKKEFPKGWYSASKGALSSAVEMASFGIQPEKDWVNKIRDNDPAMHNLYVSPKGDKFEADVFRGGSLLVNPPEGSHLAFGSVKFGWRKKTGSGDQILKHMQDYFKKMRKVVNDNKDNMSDEHRKGTF